MSLYQERRLLLCHNSRAIGEGQRHGEKGNGFFWAMDLDRTTALTACSSGMCVHRGFGLFSMLFLDRRYFKCIHF